MLFSLLYKLKATKAKESLNEIDEIKDSLIAKLDKIKGNFK
jgi:hypothetical protein